MGDLLKKGLLFYGIDATAEIIERFDIYRQLLVEWNNKFNLTAITGEDDIDLLHFVDSATIWKDAGKAGSLCDVGSGAGFPGIPLKILGAKGDIVLFDSLGKRIKFLETVIDELGLKDCRAVHLRAEDAGRGEFRETFDVAVARAVANLSVLSEYCIPLLKKEGLFIAMKGKNNAIETREAREAIKKLGGTSAGKREFTLFGRDADRTLVYIRKTGSTPDIYPRKAGTPSRRPL